MKDSKNETMDLFGNKKEKSKTNVYSTERTIESPEFELPPDLIPNSQLCMDGLEFLSHIPDNIVPVVFFDPQYRGILDKMGYGNEGKSREKQRCALSQMSEEMIKDFMLNINRILIPSGHLFLWIDKFHLCQGFQCWFSETQLEVVDLIIWDKDKMGMGYRSRRVSEYCIVVQKQPKRAKGVWKIHTIRDVWREKTQGKIHPHQKPLHLQAELIEAVTNEGDYVVDPAAGSFSVMKAAQLKNRNFLGCDLELINDEN